MNVFNRTFVLMVLAVVIALMVLVILLTWTADTDSVDALHRLTSYLDDHRDNLSKTILSLGAVVLALLALIGIVAELLPPGPEEIRLRQTSGGTLVVVADDVAHRIQEAVKQQPNVHGAQATVGRRGNSLEVTLDVRVDRDANIATIMNESSEIAQRTVRDDVGLPLAGQPTIRVRYITPSEAARTQARQPATPVEQPPLPETPEGSSSSEGAPSEPPRWGA